MEIIWKRKLRLIIFLMLIVIIYNIIFVNDSQSNDSSVIRSYFGLTSGKVLDEKIRESFLADGYSINGVMNVDDVNQLKNLKNYKTSRSGVLNDPAMLKKYFKDDFPEVYGSMNLNGESDAFYIECQSLFGSKRESYIGFLIYFNSKIVYYNYWEN